MSDELLPTAGSTAFCPLRGKDGCWMLAWAGGWGGEVCAHIGCSPRGQFCNSRHIFLCFRVTGMGPASLDLSLGLGHDEQWDCGLVSPEPQLPQMEKQVLTCGGSLLRTSS